MFYLAIDIANCCTFAFILVVCRIYTLQSHWHIHWGVPLHTIFCLVKYQSQHCHQ